MASEKSQLVTQSQLVTLKGLNQVYTDLRKRISDVGTVYKVKGSKLWSELFELASAQVGDVYNIIIPLKGSEYDTDSNKPSDTRIYNGTNVVCTKAFSSKISKGDFSTYWDIAGGVIDVATSDTAGVIKLGSDDILTLKDSDGKIITDPVSYGLQLNNDTQAYTAIPLATDKISGLISTKEQTFTGKKTFNGSVVVGGEDTSGTSDATLTVNGTVKSTGVISALAFNITGDKSSSSTITGSLSVDTLSVSQKATIADLVVNNKATLSDGTTVAGTTTLNGGLKVTGLATINSTLTAGATTTEVTKVTGDATFQKGLKVTGLATINSTLTAGATTTEVTKVTEGTTTLNGGLTVTDLATINSTLTAGATTTQKTSVTGTTTLNGGLTVTGLATINSTLTAGATTTGVTKVTEGATTLNGGLTVTDLATINSTLTAGATTTGVTKVTGATTLNGGLTVTGLATINSTLTASSIDVTGGTLKVEGTVNSTGTIAAPEIVSKNRLIVATNGEYSLDTYESISDITGVALFTKASKTKNSDNTYTDTSTVVLNTTEIGTPAEPRMLYGHGGANFMNSVLINGPMLYTTGTVDGKETQVAAGKGTALSIYSACKGAINTVEYADSDTITVYDENYNTEGETFTIKPADFNATSVETTTEGRAFIRGQVDGNTRTADINDFYTSNGAEVILGGLGVELNIAALGNISSEIGDIKAKNGSVIAQSFEATSSRKFKENIQPAEINATELIDQIDVVNFNFIRDKNKDPKIGFIAEDTPSIFSTPRKNVMDMQNCIGILLKANQELSARIKELEKKLEGK